MKCMLYLQSCYCNIGIVKLILNDEQVFIEFKQCVLKVSAFGSFYNKFSSYYLIKLTCGTSNNSLCYDTKCY